MTGMIPLGEIEASGDLTTAANIDRLSASQVAVDNRIGKQVKPLVAEAIADGSTVRDAAIAAMKDAAVIEGLSYWRGATVLTTSDVLENLAPGVYTVPTASVAAAMGFPVGTNGLVTVGRMGQVGRYALYQTATAGVFSRYHGSSGWMPWQRIDASSPEIDSRISAAVTPVNPFRGQILGDVENPPNLNDYLGPASTGNEARYSIYQIGARPANIVNMPPKVFTGFLEVLTTTNGKIFIQRFTSNDAAPEMWMRQIINGSAGWSFGTWRRIDGASSTASGGEGFDLAVRREMLVDAFTARRGGSIGTGGLPVVALRFDHHFDSFITKILPLLVERGLPWAQSVNPENLGSGDDNVTYTQLQEMCIQSGGEVWNHGGNHLDATGETAIHTQVVGALEALQSNLPRLPIEGWAPPGLPSGGYDGYSPMQTPSEHADTYAGRIILGNHAAIAGYVPGMYRVLDAQNRVGLIHATIDTATLATARGYVSACPAGMGVALMLHPNYLDQPGYMTTATLTQLLDWIVSERDAGRLQVISYSGLWAADSRSSHRHDLLAIHEANGDFSTTVALQRLRALCGGMRELTAKVKLTNPGTVTTQIGESHRSHVLAAGSHTVRHIAPVPLDAETLSIEIIGAVTVTDMHLYAV